MGESSFGLFFSTGNAFFQQKSPNTQKIRPRLWKYFRENTPIHWNQLGKLALECLHTKQKRLFCLSFCPLPFMGSKKLIFLLKEVKPALKQKAFCSFLLGTKLSWCFYTGDQRVTCHTNFDLLVCIARCVKS